MATKKTSKARNIGIQVDAPKKACDDENCPFHGTISLRGKQFVGTVIKAKMDKSAVVGWERRRLVKKYERFEKRRTRIKVHNPTCIDAQEGQLVRIQETRPISKTIHFTIIEVLGDEKGFHLKQEGHEESMSVHQKDEVAEE